MTQVSTRGAPPICAKHRLGWSKEYSCVRLAIANDDMYVFCTDWTLAVRGHRVVRARLTHIRAMPALQRAGAERRDGLKRGATHGLVTTLLSTPIQTPSLFQRTVRRRTVHPSFNVQY